MALYQGANLLGSVSRRRMNTICSASSSVTAMAESASPHWNSKAMTIADPIERLVFLNRGQAWVVRKLEALLPRVRDDALHAALREMLDSHVENIDRAERFVVA